MAQRIVLAVIVAVLGAALFVTASAYVVDHGFARWAAAGVGAFAFPVAPALWHFIGERRRKARIAVANKPPKSTLTGKDRYWMRFVVVVLIVLGPMFAQSKLGVFGSVWREGLWFVPRASGTAGDLEADDHLLKRVPSDAEVVMLVRRPAGPGKPGATAMLAWGARQAMIAADKELDDHKPIAERLDELNAKRDILPWLPFDKLAEVSTSDHTIVVASDGWKSKVEPAGAGPSEELLGELRRAPNNAVYVVAITPRTKITPADRDPVTIRHGVAWVETKDKSFAISARLEAMDASAAQQLKTEIEDVLHFKTKDIPEKCRDGVGKLVAGLQLEQNGAILSAHLEVPEDQVLSLVFCAMK